MTMPVELQQFWIARVMKKNSYSPKNSIEFVAFGAEEIGLIGSNAYAAESLQNRGKSSSCSIMI